METASLLIELGTEELPPVALPALRDALVDSVVAQLDEAGFAHGKVQRFAAPRRLAFRINDLALKQPDRQVERRGPSLKAAYDADGNPTRAAEGFAKSAGLTVDQLDKMETPKGTWLVAHLTEKGQGLAELMPAYLDKAIHQLPIPKRMHWGASRVEFVRPVHWLVALLDDKVLPLELLGLQSGRESSGHRFHHPGPVSLANATDYESALEAAHVMVDFERRRQQIEQGATQLGKQAGGEVRMLPELLDEVTALVEWPVPLLAEFEERFLRVPQEALIATMESDQKYFPVLDADGKLLNAFVFVSNIESADPQQVIAGNQRVVRPRLADAEFFYDLDCKKTLQQHAEPLKRTVFQQQLGTIADKSARVAKLAVVIAEQLGGSANWAEQAALLAKADLTTAMVGEFAKMQGIMGRYLAENQELPDEVAATMEEQYLPKHAGDALPASTTGQAVALADKIDTLVGIFGIGAKPSGTKDPFALRRAALGVLRIVVEQQLPLNLADLVDKAVSALGDKINPAQGQEALGFIIGRYRSFYQEQGFSTPLIQAVTQVRAEQPLDLDQRLHALADFQQQPACAALAAANKRVANILAKQGDGAKTVVNAGLLQEAAEKALYDALQKVDTRGDYPARLTQLSALREPVDAFFEQVMVMVDDEALKANRLALLAQLRGLFMQVADISLLD